MFFELSRITINDKIFVSKCLMQSYVQKSNSRLIWNNTRHLMGDCYEILDDCLFVVVVEFEATIM